ncbi:MAG: phage tail sheath subtilisin-like domain-containing protein [Methylococcales bacterium]|nr:phage tail sheath subtilisin-like domain-containing protein [Methylococcales bacterium]MDD5632983.1 phage tail sheath subtilisin-like domain-containing protein [Methylococcales bacterium]
MPVLLTYPGVYIEEIPSGVRTITGVATSITAFLGRASLGLTNEPVTINSFGDFERQFGGLAVDYPMSYAVRDFYSNGGSQAIIVRLFKVLIPDGADDAAKAQAKADTVAKLTVDGLVITAKSPGVWGKKLRVTIDVEVSEEVRTRLNLLATDALFNLTISLGSTSEKFLNVTVTDNARRIDRVLKAESSLVQWPEGVAWSPQAVPLTKAAAVAFKDLLSAPGDAAKKAAYDAAKVDLDDPAAKAEKVLAVALAANPQVPADIAAAQAKIKAAEVAMKGSNGEKLDQAAYEGAQVDKTGLHALDKADLFNLLCIPPDTREGDAPIAVYQTAMNYCKVRRAMLIVDAPAAWSANKDTAAAKARDGLAALNLSGESARNAALYFPRVLEADPLRDGQLDTFVPCGIVAGVMARTDTSRGVWKAPAGLEASLNGIQGLNVNLNDAENGMLNPLGINCLRSFPVNGRVIWGARTLRGADQLADEWKYIPVRRTALFIEESLYRGTQWVVFEPNDEPLWAQIRLNIGAFMHNLFRQGAFQGTTPRDAYFVKCDKETTTQNDINLGIVNIVVGFAPLKPAEFVVIKLQQIAGQIEV